jgi:SHS2 domain-containing protein
VYRWIDHTSEMELEIEAGDEHEVFAQALGALAELLASRRERVQPHRERVEATARDRPALLAAWLEELLFLAETEGFVATRIAQLELGSEGLWAEVVGHLDEPPPLVKGVTYHRLEFEPSGSGYRARVVLDV